VPPQLEDFERADIAAILDAAGVARLERLVLHTHLPQTWLRIVEESAVQRLVFATSVIRSELERDDSGRFARALAHYVVDRRWSSPQAIMRHLALVLGDRPLVFDARETFYPGMRSYPSQLTGWPTRDGIVDDLTRLDL